MIFSVFAVTILVFLFPHFFLDYFCPHNETIYCKYDGRISNSQISLTCSESKWLIVLKWRKSVKYQINIFRLLIQNLNDCMCWNCANRSNLKGEYQIHRFRLRVQNLNDCVCWNCANRSNMTGEYQIHRFRLCSQSKWLLVLKLRESVKFDGRTSNSQISLTHSEYEWLRALKLCESVKFDGRISNWQDFVSAHGI